MRNVLINGGKNIKYKGTDAANLGLNVIRLVPPVFTSLAQSIACFAQLRFGMSFERKKQNEILISNEPKAKTKNDVRIIIT